VAADAAESPNAASKSNATPIAPASSVRDRAPSLVILGIVADRAGAPVDHASVTVTDSTGRHRDSECDPQGRFASSGLSPGRVDLVARADGCLDGVATAEIDAHDASRRVDLTVQRMVRVKVRFTDLQGASLRPLLRKRLRDGGGAELRAVATLDEPGDEVPGELGVVSRWRPGDRLRDEHDGTIDVEDALPVFISVIAGERIVATEELSAPQDEMTIAIDPARLDGARAAVRLRLIDAVTHEPVLRAGIAITGPNSWTTAPLKDLPPDSDGVWPIPDQSPGAHNLAIVVGDRGSLDFRVTLAAGDNDLGDITVLAPVEVHGRVVDESGNPLHCEVRVDPVDDDHRWPSSGTFSTNSDANGRFTATVWTPRVRVHPVGEFALDPQVVDVLALGSDELTVIARRGAIVTLRPRAGDREVRHVTVRRADGAAIGDWTLRTAAPYELRLAPGDYNLTIEKDGGRRKEQTITIGEQPSSVELE